MKKLIVLILVFAGITAFAQDFSQWRGPERNGIYPETDLLEKWPENGPDMLWHYDELGPGHGSAAVTSNTVYIAGVEGENGFVLAFDMAGKIKWKKQYGKEWVESYDGVRTTPMVIGDKLYIMSGYGLVSCMDSQNGNILWQVNILKDFGGENLKWGITENLLAYDDKIICTPGGSKHNVIALDRNTGKLIWSSPGKGDISAYNSPLLIDHNGKKIIITHSKDYILALDAIDGQLLWSYEQPNRWSVHANTPLYKNGWLYVVTGYGKGGVMLELNQDGKGYREIWTDENLDNKLGGVVLLDGRIYGSGDFTRKWVCLDWKTGQELYSTKDLNKGNIIAADGLLYWYSQSGHVALVKPENDRFNIISQFQVPYGKDQHWAHLVINDGRLFVRHGTSLMVYDVKKKAIGEWRGPGRTGVYDKEKNLLKSWPPEGPELVWFNDAIPSGYASVTVYNDCIYTTGIRDEQDVVVALDNTGYILWETPYGRKWDSSYDQSRCTPTIVDDRIYVSSGLGDVACLDIDDGSIVWQENLNEKYEGPLGKFGISESLLVVDDLLIFTPGGQRTTVVALDRNTGQPVWESPAIDEDPSYTSPLLIEHNGERMIVTVTTNYMIGISPADGDLLWKFEVGQYAGGISKRKNQANTPLYKDGKLFFTSGYDHKSVMLQLAEDNRSVSVVWVDSLLDVHHGGVVEIDGFIYGSNWINNRNGDWACLKWETGEKMYSSEWKNKGSIISADGMLYCYEEKGGNVGLVPVDPNNFEVVSSFEVPYGKGPHWSHPVIDSGRLIIRHGSAIMVYDILNEKNT
jgi:outer membrane protein assembly factor BamB